MCGFEPGLLAEVFHGEMARITRTAAAAIKHRLVLPRFCISDEFRYGPDRDRRMHDQGERKTCHRGNRCEIPHRIESEFGIERWIHRERCIEDQKQRVSVGGRPCDGFGPEIASGPRSIFHNERLLRIRCQFFREQACRGVEWPTRRERNHNFDSPGRIGLSDRHGRKQQCGSRHQEAGKSKARRAPQGSQSSHGEASGCERPVEACNPRDITVQCYYLGIT